MVPRRAPVELRAAEQRDGAQPHRRAPARPAAVLLSSRGQRMDMDDFTCSHRLRVRWAEVDAQGIVFNGHYLTYFDVGMTEYLREIGVPYPDGFLAYGG